MGCLKQTGKQRTMRNPKHLLIISALILLAISCNDDPDRETRNFNFGQFSIDAPPTWQQVNQQGYDSYVAQFVTPGGETISFDLGLYSNALNVDGNTHTITFRTIDNKDAKIVKPKSPGNGTTGVFFEHIDVNGTRFQ